jgi:cytochrome c-type biogenesis protein CcmH/NrfG
MATTVIFWLVCSALIAAAVACLLWPLLRPTRSDSLSAASVNGSILRDQFGDLERDTSGPAYCGWPTSRMRTMNCSDAP